MSLADVEPNEEIDEVSNIFLFVMYCYDSNAMLVKPMKNLTDDEVTQAFKYEYLQEKGFCPIIYVMDHAASHMMKEFIEKE